MSSTMQVLRLVSSNYRMKKKLEVDFWRASKLLRIALSILGPFKYLLNPVTRTRRVLSVNFTNGTIFVFLIYNILLLNTLYCCTISIDMITGLTFLCTGLDIFRSQSVFSLIIDNHYYIIIGAVMFIAGVLIITLSILGCIGGLLLIKPILEYYTLLLIPVVIIEIVCLLFGAMYLLKIKGAFDSTMTTNIMLYRLPSDHYYQSSVNSAVDYCQKKFQCCGLFGPTDWALYNFKYLEQHNSQLPESCSCNPKTAEQTVHCQQIIMPYYTKKSPYNPVNEPAWLHGCQDALYYVLKWTVIYGISLVISNVIGAVLSLYLASISKLKTLFKLDLSDILLL